MILQLHRHLGHVSAFSFLKACTAEDIQVLIDWTKKNLK